MHAGGHRFDSDILHLGLLIPGTGLTRRFPEYSITGTFFDILEEKNLREDNSRDVVFLDLEAVRLKGIGMQEILKSISIY